MYFQDMSPGESHLQRRSSHKTGRDLGSPQIYIAYCRNITNIKKTPYNVISLQMIIVLYHRLQRNWTDDMSSEAFRRIIIRKLNAVLEDADRSFHEVSRTMWSMSETFNTETKDMESELKQSHDNSVGILQWPSNGRRNIRFGRQEWQKQVWRKIQGL